MLAHESRRLKSLLNLLVAGLGLEKSSISMTELTFLFILMFVDNAHKPVVEANDTHEAML